MRKRLHIYYSGLVQGVGFRYAAERIAESLGLVGWVRNLEDGRVEVMCEGPEKALKDFAGKIEDAFSGYIRDADIEWLNPSQEFDDFQILF